MNIIDRLPIPTLGSRVTTPDGVEEVKPFQVVVWVGLSPMDHLEPLAPRFPAILDTGLNHNLAIRREHLDRWTGLALPVLGSVEIGKRQVPRLAASVWIYRNEPGLETLSSLLPVRLRVPEGIIVYPRHITNPARLPTLSLRALVRNALTLTIDGEQREVMLATGPGARPR
jgi:hypothetical protein